MIHRRLLIKALPAIGLLTILMVVVLLFINNQRVAARDAVVKKYLEVDVQETLKTRSTAISQILSSVYENARMVSLLPGVRSIPGGNRKSDTEDVVEQGRFSKHDYDVVQQIYNNLASSVNVSEVYIVLNGFDAGKGEVPFLMLDQLIIGDSSVEDAHSEVQNSDIPEESEAEEYAYFPKQLQGLKKSYPNFTFDKLEQIPMVASPVMRTCDNTQYPSISKGDVRNAGGILFSVPIYSVAKEMIGVVVVVVRSNVLEAAIIGAPYLIITDEDVLRAKSEQWAMPAVSSLRLSNPDYGINIFDRRSTLNTEALSEHKVDVLSPVGTKWGLSYEVDSSKIESIANQEGNQFYLPIAFALGTYFLLVGVVIYYTNIRQFQERLQQLLVSLRQLAAGNFATSIPHQEVKGEIGEIAHALVNMKTTALNASDSAWVRKVLADVDVKVQSAESFQDFGNALAQSLHTNVSFDYFALYLFDKPRQVLQRYGGFACEDSSHQSQFKLGEGLVGQVAADGRSMHLTQDAGHHLHVQTGILIVPVQHIMVLPIVKSGITTGVIEIGSINPLRPVDFKLFDRVLPVLADKIEILKGHIELRELLVTLRGA